MFINMLSENPEKLEYNLLSKSAGEPPSVEIIQRYKKAGFMFDLRTGFNNYIPLLNPTYILSS
jgi:hypothetical protein